ncbi:MAG: biotin/lipoyl-binding protein [Chloroflexota bacterium]|nr:biotin/lipoyl-binding protein [Chloroflexota bacterium]
MSAPDPTDALRVGVAPATRLDGDPVLTLAPGDPLLAGLRLERQVAGRAVLVGGGSRTHLLLGVERRRTTDGAIVIEVVVEGWRVEVQLEPEGRAILRERARRGRSDAGATGPLEIRAIIPGRIVAVSVAPGEAVEPGQQLLVLEAMKMQNELRAPRSGTVEQVRAAVGQNVEVGDLLVVIT